MPAVPVPIFDESSYLKAMRDRRGSAKIYAMYSSVIGGIVTDTNLMSVPIDDHLVHRGHAVFDTCSLFNGNLYRVDIHLDRFLKSAATARIAHKWTKDDLRSIIQQTAAASGKKTANLRYWMGAGVGGFALHPAECQSASLYVVVWGSHPAHSAGEETLDLRQGEGIREFTVSVPMKPKLLATMKSNNYLLNALMSMESTEKGGRYGILTYDGKLAEAAVCCVGVLTKDKEFLTPPFDCILAGTTVRRCMDICRDMCASGELKDVRQQEVPLDTVYQAEELLMLSGDWHVESIVELDGRPIGTGQPGPLAKRVRDTIMREANEGTHDCHPVPYHLYSRQ
ncbi:unnamed protein product [Vitrella brassicaformis CCMP3155]|uniref:Uncharacterized protein n=1 Tax=Vitrella brassicaformis (strain CCMP3155) TaxID=1169540 RepID=A0A0G4FE59_VITBC|nr:unnamed protein product [Vitrella brassicaformis CCMP3155]|eukprot:CEM11150.1 unnamed protein product [Vitrella brassicaformis CCMP3155]